MGSDCERCRLDGAALRRDLLAPHGGFSRVDLVDETASTNADLVAAATAGAPDRRVLVAEYQSAGRGRAGRGWQAPPRSGLFCSVLLRPTQPPQDTWGWLPLLAGVALAAVVERLGVATALKWPNDLLLGPAGAKAAGILAEVAGRDAVIVGIGCNVSTRREELPVAEATSLALERATCLDRQRLLVALLGELDQRVRHWAGCAGDAEAAGLAGQYRRRCATLGRRVRVTLPGQRDVTATAVDVDDRGRLVLDDGGIRRAVSAGEITHLRG